MTKTSSFLKEFLALGTDIYIKVNNVSREEAEKIFDLIENLYRREEKTFSRFDKKSELSFFNRNIGKFLKASPDFLKICKKAIYFFRKSHGYFDPRIIEFLEDSGYDKNFKDIQPKNFVGNNWKPFKNSLEEELLIKKDKASFLSKMDFSGIAKSFIAQEAAKIAESQGIKDFLIDTGGDMLARGNNNGKKWIVDLEGIDSSKINIDISERSIATSGITRKKWQAGKKKIHHLINPLRPGNFSFDLRTVTVLNDNLMLADFWAKILFVRGISDGLKIAKEENIEALFLDYKNRLYEVNNKNEK